MVIQKNYETLKFCRHIQLASRKKQYLYTEEAELDQTEDVLNENIDIHKYYNIILKGGKYDLLKEFSPEIWWCLQKLIE